MIMHMTRRLTSQVLYMHVNSLLSPSFIYLYIYQNFMLIYRNFQKRTHKKTIFTYNSE